MEKGETDTTKIQRSIINYYEHQKKYNIEAMDKLLER